MKLSAENEYEWLRALEALYLLKLKYPDDEYIYGKVNTIANVIGFSEIGESIDGFIELAEMSYVDTVNTDRERGSHYVMTIEEKLRRLKELEKMGF